MKRRDFVRSALLSVCIALLSTVTASAQDSKSQAVTLTGEVVDAACYMIHPQSATGPGHKECASHVRTGACRWRS